MDDLQKQIDDNEQKLKGCGKYDYVCQAKYKGIIVSLQAAKATADAALSAAQAVLQAAQDELAKIPDPDVDPEIIGWKAEVVADQLAVQSADETIGGLEKLIDFANQVVQAGPGEPQSAVSARAPSYECFQALCSVIIIIFPPIRSSSCRKTARAMFTWPARFATTLSISISACESLDSVELLSCCRRTHPRNNIDFFRLTWLLVLQDSQRCQRLCEWRLGGAEKVGLSVTAATAASSPTPRFHACPLSIDE